MRPWKAMLGLGAACAACCAVPLLGVAGGFGAFAAFASALCVDELVPAAIVLGIIAAVLAGLWWLQRRRAARAGQCDCATSCTTEVEHAKT